MEIGHFVENTVLHLTLIPESTQVIDTFTITLLKHKNL